MNYHGQVIDVISSKDFNKLNMNWKSYQKYFKGKKLNYINSGFVDLMYLLTLSLLGSKILGYSLKRQ